MTEKIFRNIQELYAFLEWPIPHNVEKVCATFSTFIPERIAKKIKTQGKDSVLAKEFLPDLKELDANLNLEGLFDPIGDKNFNRAPQIIHRYQSRVLFTPTLACPIHCRYCFRRNELNAKDDLFKIQLQDTLYYLKNHTEINEIIFTGGDPLSLSNEKIDKYLQLFSEISHIKHIRFHSRYPVILPSRIDDDFIRMINDYSTHFQTLSLAIHANHIEEFDEEVNLAINKMSQTRCQLLSQTVLLKGVNDNLNDLKNLMEHFISLKIRPYYLHHPDQVFGGMHFYLPLSRGRKVYSLLRKSLPGWAIPQYVVDIPGGEGKVSAFNPESFEFKGQLINKNGQFVEYKEPSLT